MLVLANALTYQKLQEVGGGVKDKVVDWLGNIMFSEDNAASDDGTETAGAESGKTVEERVDDILENTEPGNETKGKSEQRTKEDGFEHLNPDNVKDRSTDEKQVKTGELKGGKGDGGMNVNVRNKSIERSATLEV